LSKTSRWTKGDRQNIEYKTSASGLKKARKGKERKGKERSKVRDEE